MSTAYIALGSNSADALTQLLQARSALDELAFSKLRKVSPLFQTAPWGDANQPDFLNAVVELKTELAPTALLAELQRIEQAQGRQRDPTRQFGPRTLDLDLLSFAGVGMQSATLTLPHPRMHIRAFVLIPLRTIAPDFSWPGLASAQGKLQGKLDTWLAALPAEELLGVKPFPAPDWDQYQAVQR